jgi:hypothetical protein
MAATGLINWRDEGDGITRLRVHHPNGNGGSTPGEFRVFNGSFADFGINVPRGFSVTGFNVRDGQVTAVMRGNVIGSRLEQTRYDKVDPEKLRR